VIFDPLGGNESSANEVLMSMEILVAVLILVLIDLAAWKWGADSREWTVDERSIAPRRPRRAF
jgi:hypothetical protein